MAYDILLAIDQLLTFLNVLEPADPSILSVTILVATGMATFYVYMRIPEGTCKLN